MALQTPTCRAEAPRSDGPAPLTALPAYPVDRVDPFSPETPSPGPAAPVEGYANGYAMGGMGQASGSVRGSKPFSTVAVGVKAGVTGVGFDIATPLARKFNLRAGGTFLGYTLNVKEDGIPVAAHLLLRTGTVGVDYFPFGGGFHISPSFTFYNGNHINGTATVPGGNVITLNGQDYTSDPTNPLHGDFSMVFGRRTAPGVTIGWGNMIPRSGRHFSVPFEMGFEYVGDPQVVINLSGNACQNGGCGPVNSDPSFQANEAKEQQLLNDDIKPLRFFPVISLGFAVRF
ncbi:hypothetical protein [Bryocella elongata]|nr:hypothetical protein [Bryocella elongata]